MPQIRNIKFDPILHKYTDEDDLVYTSVTQKIGLVTPVFDEHYWASKKAQERGITKAEVLKEWENIRNYACDKGNAVHEKLEDSVNEAAIGRYIRTGGGSSTPSFKLNYNPIWGYEIDLDIFLGTPLAICYPKIAKLLKFYIDKGWKLYSEKRVYLYEYLISGTIDLLLVKGDEFIIVDWKTNKDVLKFESGYYKKENGIKTTQWIKKNEKFLPPLDNLAHCKGMIYTVQLSTYAYVTECWGYKCKGLILAHIIELDMAKALERNKESDAKIDIYAIDYLKRAAKTLVEFNPAKYKPKPKSNNIDFAIK